MKKTTTVGELKTLIREKVLPAYESAYADENCPKETIEALNEVVKKVKELEEHPCCNCQGGGCPVCGGWGVIKS